MTNDKCIDCGRPASKEGVLVYCDYHHAKALKDAEMIIKLTLEDKPILHDCDNCHIPSDLENCYFIRDMVALCETCYQNDRTLHKRESNLDELFWGGKPKK